MNSTIVAAFVSSKHSMISLPPASITATEMVAWCTSMPLYFSGLIKALLFARLVIRTISTYRKSGRLFILRVMGIFHQLCPDVMMGALAFLVRFERTTEEC